jgi:CelD/BcsL family acetyltransferase involved in cellulose biosynthesis
MFQVFARTRGYCPTLWATVGDDGRILALLLPVRITVLGGVLRHFTTRAVVYGSVLCAPGPEGREALALLLRTYNRQVDGDVLFTELRNLSDLSDARAVLSEHRFTYEEHLNFLIDLARPQTEIWQNIRSNARRNIQKARKSGVAIEEITDPGEVSIAYGLLGKVYKHIQVPLPDRSLFLSAFEILRPKGMFRALIARADGHDIGALTLLLYKGTLYYWYTGTLREYSAYRAGDLLVWHALELGNREGFGTFDFGGGGKPDEEYGVRDFKAKFGGTLVNYGRNTSIHAPVRMNLSRAGYELVRRLL